jgi:hypothetical protein
MLQLVRGPSGGAMKRQDSSIWPQSGQAILPVRLVPAIAAALVAVCLALIGVLPANAEASSSTERFGAKAPAGSDAAVEQVRSSGSKASFAHERKNKKKKKKKRRKRKPKPSPQPTPAAQPAPVPGPEEPNWAWLGGDSDTSNARVILYFWNTEINEWSAVWETVSDVNGGYGLSVVPDYSYKFFVSTVYNIPAYFGAEYGWRSCRQTWADWSDEALPRRGERYFYLNTKPQPWGKMGC